MALGKLLALVSILVLGVLAVPVLAFDISQIDIEVPDNFTSKDLSPEQLDLALILYNSNIDAVPQARDLLANERINLFVEDFGNFSIVNKDGMMQSIDEGAMDDPSLNLYTDKQTVNDILSGKIQPMDVLKEGKLKYEGVGFWNWLRMSFMAFLFSIGSALGMV